MADPKEKGAAAGAQQQQDQAQQRPAQQQPDPRFTRPPNREPGFETSSVCGYDAKGTARTFNLVKGEKLPDGWSDAPPAGTHPNDPTRAAS